MKKGTHQARADCHPWGRERCVTKALNNAKARLRSGHFPFVGYLEKPDHGRLACTQLRAVQKGPIYFDIAFPNDETGFWVSAVPEYLFTRHQQREVVRRLWTFWIEILTA